MSVNSYLTDLASKLVLKGSEKASIITSIATLEKRLTYYFGKDIKEQFYFGSYTRGTILPRKADDNSDIDYMIVFDNSNNYKPQTYLNKLKSFANNSYSTSEIFQSHPTIVLELNHIKFELVPAYNAGGIWFKDYKIPAPSNILSEWTFTNPNGFNESLTQANKGNNYNIKPVVRLIKYWNAQNGYIYRSFELEQSIIYNSNRYIYYGCSSLRDYFYKTVENLSTCGLSQTLANKVRKLKQSVGKVKQLEEIGCTGDAEKRLKSILPELR